jgi:hypothetical protein
MVSLHDGLNVDIVLVSLTKHPSIHTHTQAALNLNNNHTLTTPCVSDF